MNAVDMCCLELYDDALVVWKHRWPDNLSDVGCNSHDFPVDDGRWSGWSWVLRIRSSTVSRYQLRGVPYPTATPRRLQIPGFWHCLSMFMSQCLDFSRWLQLAASFRQSNTPQKRTKLVFRASVDCYGVVAVRISYSQKHWIMLMTSVEFFLGPESWGLDLVAGFWNSLLNLSLLRVEIK